MLNPGHKPTSKILGYYILVFYLYTRKRNAKKKNGSLRRPLQITVKRREAKGKGKRKDISI